MSTNSNDLRTIIRGPLFVVVVVNNDGGEPASLHGSLDSAKQWIRFYLQDGDPPLSNEEAEATESDLAALSGEYVEQVRGSQAWKEVIYVAPIEMVPEA